ncbi:MAG: outer membrane protein OmpA-like peptidoglycan-associated protein [Dasania sp.]|jgi:outer membrane protein OmpA-like peptidoglycan-associated protein
MSNISKLAVAGIAIALAGCGLPGTFYAEQFAMQPISGSDFKAELAKAYQQRVNNSIEFDENWILAGMYAQKGTSSLDGQTVLPWNHRTYMEQPAFTTGVDGGRATKYNLDSHYTTLISALDNGGRTQRPYACAQAQAHYDWLVDETYQDTPPYQEDEEAKIAMDLQRFLGECVGHAKPMVQKTAPQAATEWVIYFGFDRSNLTTEAMNVAKDAAQVARKMAGKMLSVAGFTDTSGSMSYNQRLSDKRASNVASALRNNGVNDVRQSGFGEKSLAKPTADGVRETLNRRAVIAIK